MAGRSDRGATHRSVLVYLAVNCAELAALGIAAGITGSVALRAQTAANVAEVAVEVFLLIGVLSSARPADASHPLGYGRERFFWSLFAALATFVGGSGLALDEAVEAALHPSAAGSYLVGYVALAATAGLDTFALVVALRPLRKEAARRGRSLARHLQRSTDPAGITVVVGGGCAVIGGLVAAAGLALSETTGSPTPDTVASAFIGLMLFVASVLLLQTNRELLTGRGVPPPMLREMSQIVASQPGVIEVPDLFAVVIGPSSLIVDGEVTFDDNLDVPAVEEAIAKAVDALRQRWPSIEYVYLTPVSGTDALVGRPRFTTAKGRR
jgi:cation diffusion facilitator family transporter